MPKTILAALLATAFVALPAAAQTVDIDDDGWTRVDTPAAATATVDIDDDGWTRVDIPSVQVGRAQTARPGDCTQLERSAGLTGSACGTLDMNALTFLKGDD